MSGNLRTAQLVRSIAGRDEGKYYLVIDCLSETLVLLVNGTERKLDCPKKKNLKHLKVYPVVVEEIEKGLLSGEQITNLEVARAIDNIINNSS